MKVIGAGLSKTGTSSLARALTILGFRTIHHDRERLNSILDGSNIHPDFRIYDDVDAVVDLPTAWFWYELLQAYPDTRCILTLRDEDGWWKSVSHHMGIVHPIITREQNPFLWDLRHHVYGSSQPFEFIYRKRFREHNDRVRFLIPPERLLTLNIIQGDGWQPLCDFLGLRVPNIPFPFLNRRA